MRIARVLEHFSLVRDDGNRITAVRLWKSLPPHAAGYGVPALARALRDESPGVREQVASVLGWLGEDEAREAAPDLARAAVADDDPAVRKAAMLALIEVEPNVGAVARLVLGQLRPDRGLRGLELDLRSLGESGADLWKAIAGVLQAADGRLPPPPKADGPDPDKPSDFWWNGEKKHIAHKTGQLLGVLWKVERIRTADAVKRAWNANVVRPKLVTTHVNKLKTFLQAVGVPFHYRQGDGFIVRKSVGG